MSTNIDLAPTVQPTMRPTSHSEWRTASLGDCAQLVRQSVPPSEMGDALYIGLEHIGEGTLSLTGQGSASEVTSAKTMFQHGDILFGKLRPYFRKVVQAPSQGICSTDIWVVRAVQGVEQNYLYYCMASEEFVRFATSGSEGTKMPRAIWDYVSRFEVQLPPLYEQQHIAGILGALDEKIELNRRTNETLEQMARALFKSWFVDFNPVRAKMDGRWRRSESMPGLPAELYDLFPDRLVPSGLGEIPEGWEVKTLGDFSNLNPESWSGTNNPKDIEYVDLANTKWGVLESTQRFQWKDAPTRAKRILRTGDTIVGTVRPGNGSYSYIGQDGLTGSTGFAVLRPLRQQFRELTYLAATALSNIERLSHRADGAAYPAIRPEVVGDAELAVPAVESDVFSRFSMITGHVFGKMELAKTESRTLAAQRDALLPKLVSSELRVPAAVELRVEQD